MLLERISPYFLAIFGCITFSWWIVVNIHSFLAPYAPINAEALVVEGWMNDPALEVAKREFESHDYQKLITTGTPVPRGYYLLEYKNFAAIAGATLQVLGVKEEEIVVVPSEKVIRDRTEAMALALREWLLTNNPEIKSINLWSFDVHTRRSWLIYQRVLSPEIKVGIIAIASTEYDYRRWWTSSVGVKSVIEEVIAYFYTKLRLSKKWGLKPRLYKVAL